MNRKRYLWSLVVVFLFVTLFLAVAPANADSKWSAKYWNNTGLNGDSVLKRDEDKLDHDWGSGSPDDKVNSDNFSARWTRKIQEPAGVYRFTITTDDAMRVWIDDYQLINVWYDSQAHTVSADHYLDGNEHEIKVEYYERGGQAVARVNWAPTGAAPPGGWNGEYFNNMDVAGAPTYVRQDPAIDFVWYGSPASGIEENLFSVRWTQSLALQPGTYRFSVTTDDGARLWVNNQLVIDKWFDQTATTYTADVAVSGGSIPVKMEYYDHAAEAVARLTWSQISSSAPPPPPPPPVPSTPPMPMGTWSGQYFNNETLSGEPAAIRNDSAIDFTWGSSSPIPNVIAADNFSVRWTQTIALAPGQYQFTATVDDGVRVWVNNQLIIDEWRIQTTTTFNAVINLAGGNIPVKMEFYEYNGLAEARLTASQLSGATPPQVQPPAPPPTPTPPAAPPASGVPQATMTGVTSLYVRSGPAMSFEPVGYLSYGQTVNMLGRDADAIWIQVEFGSGAQGWVVGRYLTPNTDFNSLPVTG